MARMTKEDRPSTDEICAACCGRSHPGSVQCCRNVGFAASEGT